MKYKTQVRYHNNLVTLVEYVYDTVQDNLYAISKIQMNKIKDAKTKIL